MHTVLILTISGCCSKCRMSISKMDPDAFSANFRCGQTHTKRTSTEDECSVWRTKTVLHKHSAKWEKNKKKEEKNPHQSQVFFIHRVSRLDCNLPASHSINHIHRYAHAVRRTWFLAREMTVVVLFHCRRRFWLLPFIPQVHTHKKRKHKKMRKR